MKQRFSSLDVTVIAHELSNSLCTLRLANVYDLSSRIFLLKFAKPDHREQMVIDSGFRCHLTSFARTTAAAPSAFVARLRKYLRTRRVTSVTQVGTDRIIEFQFSNGQYRLFLEFYAGGNIVLTDNELNILALLRIVSEGQEQEELRQGLKYSLENRQNYGGIPPLTKERVREGLQRALDRGSGDGAVPGKKIKKKAGDALRKALATTVTEFPPVLVDHALRVKEFGTNTPVEDVVKDDSLLDQLMLVLEEADRVVKEITALETSKGYIVAKLTKTRRAEKENLPTTELKVDFAERGNLLYEDFHPFRPRQFEEVPETTIIQFDGFNKTVDEFFSSIESQKLESRLTEREEQARKKLEAARQDHKKRVGGLQQVQELNVQKARAIEANLQRVQEAIAAINGLIAQGMDWVEIARLIEMEQARHNPVAEMIKLPLKLYENTATLLLAEASFDDDDDFEGDETGSDVSDSEDEKAMPTKTSKHAKPIDKRHSVDVDLALSPWSNARQYYDQKKTAAVKEQKTLQSSAMALKNTEKKISGDLKKGLKQEKEVLRPVRKQLWFEKFYYFISSDGYLVLGGRDDQQNEILYKKYLKKGDVYVHADLNGATSIVIKNKPSMVDSPIPPSTLSQAGTYVVSSSSAWDSKAVMSAWWVNADQVSKTAPSGEYLTAGAFVVKGKKNFLPPAQLLLGFGVMFHISEESKARHLKHRLRDGNDDIGKNSGDSTLAKIDDEADAESDDSGMTDHSVDDHDPEGEAPTTTGEAGEINDIGEPGNNSANEDEEDEDLTQYDNPLQSSHSVTANIDSEPGNNSANEVEEDKDPTQYDNPLQSSHSVTANKDSELSPEPVAKEGAILETPMKSPDNGHESSNDHSESDEGTTVNDPQPKDKSTATTLSSIRHLSSKERRLLRKGPPGSSLTPSQPSINHFPSTNSVPPPAPSAISANTLIPNKTPSPASPHIRGKHGQRSKQKAKYAHQDDEDRALAMRLLGSTAASEKAISDADAKAAHDAEAAAQKERRREQHLRAQQAGKESEEIRRLNLEDGVDALDDDAAADLNLLENFVGMSLPGDEILDALIVCAPWDSVGARLRWRVKMQPGTVKKGKAVREILGHWGKAVGEKEKRRMVGVGEEGYEEDRVMRREGELVRGFREGEVVGVVPVGKCRVVVGGGGERSKASAGKGKRGGRGSKKAR